MEYTVEWEEWTYDAFDNIDSINGKKDFSIEAESFEDAKKKAQTTATNVVRKERKSMWSSGDFIARLLKLTDEDGNELIISKPHKISESYLIVEI